MHVLNYKPLATNLMFLCPNYPRMHLTQAMAARQVAPFIHHWVLDIPFPVLAVVVVSQKKNWDGTDDPTGDPD